MAVLQTLPAGAFDAVITDPPYSSGGFTRGDRTQPVATKYVQTGSERFAGADFAGDNRDQRAWTHWCHWWLQECLRVVRPGGYVLTFTDWRQLPAATDAVQFAGWVWRGILSWDKGPAARSAAPHYFRHQCEYVVWGTAGACSPAVDWPPPGKGCYPGAYSCPVTQADKEHVTGKPTRLMRDLMRCVPPGGLILDPFAGSGTTLVGAVLEGRRALGIEISPEHCETAERRIREARGDGSLFAGGSSLPPGAPA
jgi:site-specific DNA-methyltransferase (adenine-specific)